MNYKQKREKFKKSLLNLEEKIYSTMMQHPELREIENSNDLIRKIWEWQPKAKADSILRLARKIRAESPELDTKNNQGERANAETAYREYNQPTLHIF